MIILGRALYLIVYLSVLVITIISVSSLANDNKIQEFKNDKIDESLEGIIETQITDGYVSVIVVLKEQPAHDISVSVKKEYKKDFEDITEPAREIYSRIKPLRGSEKELKTKSLPELIVLEKTLLTEHEKTVLKDVGQELDSKRKEMRRAILDHTTTLVDKSQAPIIDKINAKGGIIKFRSKIYNAIAVDIPISYLEELSAEPDIYMIYKDHVLNASLDVSTPVIGANTWWGNGYTGSDMDAAIIDTGINGSHPALSVDYAGVFHATGATDPIYNDNSSITVDLNGHGTHIAGIVASNNTTYQGVGYGIDKMINAKAGWNGTDNKGHMVISDGMQAINWSIFGNPDDADVISFSFNGEPVIHGSSIFEHFLDSIVYDLDIPIVVSAGDMGLDGAHNIGEPASAYNILAVGGMNDNSTQQRTDDYLDTYSSRGPTYFGRIKPDISAPGTNIMSANNNWESQEDFVPKSGTSMAAPHIAGAVILVLDYKNMRWQPEAIKALLLNAAEDKGDEGPDTEYGFGYVDLSNAYIHRDDVMTGSINYSQDGGVGKFYKGSIDIGDKATLVWNKHVTYNWANDPILYSGLSDLNLYMYDNNGSQISSSISRINNVEQVKSNTNYSSAIVKVDLNGTFPINVTLEDFALATDQEFTQVTPPILNVTIYDPGNVDGGTEFTLEVNITNLGDLTAYSVSVNLTMPAGFSIVSGANPRSLENISNGSSNNVSWLVKGPRLNEPAQYILNATAISQSYGESFSGEGNNTITVIEDGYVNGTVWGNGTEIPGAIVSSNASGPITSNASGFYSLRLPTGTHNLTATSEPVFYPNSSVVVWAVSGTIVEQDIELSNKPTGTISGSVRNV